MHKKILMIAVLLTIFGIGRFFQNQYVTDTLDSDLGKNFQKKISRYTLIASIFVRRLEVLVKECDVYQTSQKNWSVHEPRI